MFSIAWCHYIKYWDRFFARFFVPRIGQKLLNQFPLNFGSMLNWKQFYKFNSEKWTIPQKFFLLKTLPIIIVKMARIACDSLEN